MFQQHFSSLQDRLNAEDASPALAADIETAVVARRSERGEHRDWALLCEQAGLMSLAFSEFQLALRDDRDDPVAGCHLAQLYRERGDTSRALGLLDRLLQQQPANESRLNSYVEILVEDGGASPLVEQVVQQALSQGLAPESADRLRRIARPAGRGPTSAAPAEPQAELSPSDADCVRFCTLFSGREGVYARQWAKTSGESGYTPVHEPLTPAAIRNHLLGSFTASVYLPGHRRGGRGGVGVFSCRPLSGAIRERMCQEFGRNSLLGKGLESLPPASRCRRKL